MLSLDDFELTGEEKEKADQHHKKWCIEQAEQSLGIKQVEIAEQSLGIKQVEIAEQSLGIKQVEIAEQSLGIKRDEIEQKEIEEKREKEQAEKSSRDFNRQSQQLHFYSEMRIAEQVEAMRRIEAEKKTSIEQTKPIKKTKNEQRDYEFTQWINETKPDLKSMTKDQIQQELIKRNSHLWCSGFDGWNKDTELYKGKAGRPKKQ
jgi:hypothetical protein